jgi:hypothetical protein
MHKNVTNPITIAQQANTEIYIKADNSHASAPQKTMYAPSVMLSFASLDICICPVECDEILA